MGVRHGEKRAFWRSPAGAGLGVFLALAALLLLLEHRAHVLGAWPLLLVIVGLGVSFFIHRGRDRGRLHTDEGPARSRERGDDGQ